MKASLALQRGVVEAWGQDAVLRALGVPLYDGPPADARPPYATIGADVVTEQGWAGGGSREHRFRMSLWDGRHGAAAAKAIMAEMSRVVLGLPRTLEGCRLVSLRLVRSEVKTNPKGWTQGILEFRAVTEMEA